MGQTKIIGFLISRDDLIPKVDFFDTGITTHSVKSNGFNIFLWGFGEIESYNINNKFSLSFPLNDSLLDRNVLIEIKDDRIVVENDWLGSIPIYYNEKEEIISTLPNLCLKNKSINKEGLTNFCEFGYSVFEQTIFEDVKFLRFYSKIIIASSFEITHKKDPVLDAEIFSKESKEEDVVALMQDYISNIEKSIEGDIILPTSGGYDSRILNYLVKNKSRIKSFTYGITKNQEESSEVVFAKRISEIYNTSWTQIKLDRYNRYIKEWYDIYGFSTHLHGMYHIDFYKKIFQNYKNNNASFLSGIIGDAWSELGKFKKVSSSNDIINLGYTHGMNLDLTYLKDDIVCSSKMKEQFFRSYSEYLANDKVKAIFAMRIKLLLISYLTQIPEYFGVPVWTPFLNYEIAINTLNIADNRRINRVWQKDLFLRENLNLEDMNLNYKRKNSLNYEVALNTDFELLDVDVLSLLFKPDKITEVNNVLLSFSKDSFMTRLFFVPKIGEFIKILGFRNKKMDKLLDYYVLKAIEKGLK